MNSRQQSSRQTSDYMRARTESREVDHRPEIQRLDAWEQHLDGTAEGREKCWTCSWNKVFFSLFKKEKENQIVAKNAQPRYVQRSIKSEAVFMKAVDVGHSKAKSFQDIHVYIHILYILYIIYYIYVLKYVNVLDYCAELPFPKSKLWIYMFCHCFFICYKN